MLIFCFCLLHLNRILHPPPPPPPPPTHTHTTKYAAVCLVDNKMGSTRWSNSPAEFLPLPLQTAGFSFKKNLFVFFVFSSFFSLFFLFFSLFFFRTKSLSDALGYTELTDLTAVQDKVHEISVYIYICVCVCVCARYISTFILFNTNFEGKISFASVFPQ